MQCTILKWRMPPRSADAHTMQRPVLRSLWEGRDHVPYYLQGHTPRARYPPTTPLCLVWYLPRLYRCTLLQVPMPYPVEYWVRRCDELSRHREWYSHRHHRHVIYGTEIETACMPRAALTERLKLCYVRDWHDRECVFCDVGYSHARDLRGCTRCGVLTQPTIETAPKGAVRYSHSTSLRLQLICDSEIHNRDSSCICDVRCSSDTLQRCVWVLSEPAAGRVQA